MRFQAIERVSSNDSERVLFVLEQHLRSVAGGVERDGSRIILSGLGPSPRTINRMDTTVIDVLPEDGSTRIDAQVSFQASALLGSVGQEEIVREKLEKIFGATKEQLEIERIEAARARERAEAAGVEAERAEAARAEAAKANADRAEAGRAEAERVEARRVEAANAETRRLANIAARRAAAEAAEAEAEKKQMQEAVAALIAARSASSTAKSASSETKSAAEKTPLRDAEHEAASGDAGGLQMAGTGHGQRKEGLGRWSALDRAWLKWAGLGACLLIVALVAGYFSMRQGSWVVRQGPVSTGTDGATKKALPDAGPEGAVHQWELAMRSTDVGTQVAYYSVPVQQYMFKHNVSRHDLEAIKQAEIARRRGLWTVKMEDVHIKREGDMATVTLVKHTMEQPQGTKVRERLIPSQLTLKNSLGIWWITSERDLAQRRQSTVAEESETPSWARPAPQANAAQASVTPSAALPN